MKNNTLIKEQILKSHSIPFLTAHGEILALHVTNQNKEWVNVTNWTVKKLYEWLGY